MRNFLLALFGLLLTQPLSATDVYATFNIIPNKEATLSFTASGTIAESLVDIGSVVKKGQNLARLENSEEEMLLKLAQKDLDNAKIKAEKELNSYERYTKIKEILDQEKYENIVFAKKMSENSAQKAGFNVKLRQSQLDKTIIRAPFDGVITARFKQVGDAVTGMQVMPYFHIMDLSSVKMILEFDERYSNDVKVGQTFTYAIEGLSTKFEGKISKVHPTIDEKSRKIKAEVMTTNLKPGLFGQGIIKVD